MRDRISKLTPIHVSLIYTIELNSIGFVYGDLHCIPQVCIIKNNFFVVLAGLSAPQKKILKLKRIPEQQKSGAKPPWGKFRNTSICDKIRKYISKILHGSL